MNAEPKEILKKDSIISKTKKESSRNKEEKQWKDLQRHENVRGKIKVTLGIKTKLNFYLRSDWFSSRKT